MPIPCKLDCVICYDAVANTLDWKDAWMCPVRTTHILCSHGT